MINSATYDYIVFYYYITESVSTAKLKSLYAQRLKDQGENTSLSDEEDDIISFYIKEGADNVSSKILAYCPDDVLGYEYAKSSIDPDILAGGDFIVYRAYFDEDKLLEGILQKIDRAIDQYISVYVKSQFSQEIGSEDWNKLQLQLEQANERLERAISFRKSPPVITQNNF